MAFDFNSHGCTCLERIFLITMLHFYNIWFDDSFEARIIIS
jgi:hypothetical protein